MFTARSSWVHQWRRGCIISAAGRNWPSIRRCTGTHPRVRGAWSLYRVTSKTRLHPRFSGTIVWLTFRSKSRLGKSETFSWYIKHPFVTSSEHVCVIKRRHQSLDITYIGDFVDNGAHGLQLLLCKVLPSSFDTVTWLSIVIVLLLYIVLDTCFLRPWLL